MLRHRVITAVLGLPIFIGSFYYGGLFWIGIVLLLATIGSWESARLLGHGKPSSVLLAVIGSYAVIGTTYYITVGNDRWLTGPSIIVLAVVMVAALIYVYKAVGHRNSIIAVIGAALYPGLFFSSFITLRTLGFQWLLFAAVITWVTDTAAYFIGRQWGSRPLWAKISPKKTIEGALGGWVLATISGALIGLWWGQHVVAWTCVALICSAIAQIGDLYESGLKRRSGVKDSGAILPGHGGILDRFDSLLFSVSVVYLLHFILR